MSNEEYLKAYYSKGEKPYTGYPSLLTRFLIHKFKLGKNKILLDVGYGRGEYLRTFEKEGYKVLGVERAQGYDFEKDRFTKYEDNYFDIIFCKSVLEHIFNYDSFMRELYRILKIDGKIIILTPDWQSIYDVYWDDYSHKHPYTLTSLKKILKAYHFKVIYCKKFRQLPLLWGTHYFHPQDLFKIKKNIKFWKHVMLLGVGIK